MTWSLFSQGQVTPKSWAESVLKAGGWPRTDANIQSLIAWALNEGGGGEFNPLNTTEPEPGAGSFNSVGVRNYKSWQQGIAATVATLQSSDYTDITYSLSKGQGLEKGSYGGLYTWSGGGYSNVSGTWSGAAKYMAGNAVVLPASAGGGGGGKGGGGSLGTWVSQLYNSLFGTVPTALDQASGVSDVAQAVTGLAAPFIKVAQFVDFFLVPAHWIRIASGIGGGILVLHGISNLSRTGEGTGRLAFGIGETGAGSILLFVAFHNLPSTVQTFPDFLAHIQSEAQRVSQEGTGQ